MCNVCMCDVDVRGDIGQQLVQFNMTTLAERYAPCHVWQQCRRTAASGGSSCFPGKAALPASEAYEARLLWFSYRSASEVGQARMAMPAALLLAAASASICAAYPPAQNCLVSARTSRTLQAVPALGATTHECWALAPRLTGSNLWPQGLLMCSLNLVHTFQGPSRPSSNSRGRRHQPSRIPKWVCWRRGSGLPAAAGNCIDQQLTWQRWWRCRPDSVA